MASPTREQLEEELMHKLYQVERSVAAVIGVQGRLAKNVQQVNSEIHSDISKLLESVRLREDFLKSQAQVILSVKDEILQHQLYELNQAARILKEGVTFAEKNQVSSEDYIITHLQGVLQRVRDVMLRPIDTSTVTYHSDLSPLKQHMAQLGLVSTRCHSDFDQSRAFADPQLGARSLPSPVEEEGEGEEMLTKAVGADSITNTTDFANDHLLPATFFTGIQNWLSEIKTDGDGSEENGATLQLLSPTSTSAVSLYFKTVLNSPSCQWLQDKQDEEQLIDIDEPEMVMVDEGDDGGRGQVMCEEKSVTTDFPYFHHILHDAAVNWLHSTRDVCDGVGGDESGGGDGLSDDELFDFISDVSALSCTSAEPSAVSSTVSSGDAVSSGDVVSSGGVVSGGTASSTYSMTTTTTPFPYFSAVQMEKSADWLATPHIITHFG